MDIMTMADGLDTCSFVLTVSRKERLCLVGIVRKLIKYDRTQRSESQHGEAYTSFYCVCIHFAGNNYSTVTL